MNYFTIQDIDILTGVKAHTLRVWEKRYQFMSVQRKDSNHRFYTANDLKRILKVVTLYNRGYKLSKMDLINLDQIDEIIAQIPYDGDAFDVYINQLIEATVDYDEALFIENIRKSFTDLGVPNAFQKVVFPFLHKIGNLWLSENVHVAQEHFCSTLLRNEIIRLIDNITLIDTFKNVHYLLATPEKEEHEIPLLLVHYLLKRNGYKVTYAGKNVDTEMFFMMQQKLKVDFIWLHCITNLTGFEWNDYISLLQQETKAKLILSGPSFEGVQVINDVAVLHSFEDILNATL